MRTTHLSLCLLALAASAGLLRANTIRVPKDYPNLQAAHDAAAPGDTIIITDDTPGALLSKPLTIRGTGGAAVSSALGTGSASGFPNFGGNTYGIGLTSGASGTLIHNVTIDATSYSARPDLGIVTGGFFGSAASNVTVKQCNIIETFQGISGRCVGSGVGSSCPTGWNVSQNDISLNSGPTTNTGAYIGIVAFNGADNWTIIHNKITRPNNPAPALSDTCFFGISGIEVLATSSPAYQPSPVAITAAGVKQNRVSVQGQCVNLSGKPACGTETPFPTCGEPVDVVADGTNALNTLTTVAYNDLRGSDFSTLVFAGADPSNVACPNPPSASSDLTGLHQYGFQALGSGAVTCFTSLGNLDDFGNGNRGSTSSSLVRPGHVLPK
jgi:hypothetical protein